jgi:anti-anti-sigma factor
MIFRFSGQDDPAGQREGANRGPDLRKEPEVLVRCDETEASVVCHVTGDLDQASVGEFREVVAQLNKKKKVIFELSAVPFVDAAGLGALIGAVRRIRDRRGRAVVCAARPSVRRVLQLVGIPRVVTIVDSVKDAQAFFVHPGVV